MKPCTNHTHARPGPRTPRPESPARQGPRGGQQNMNMYVSPGGPFTPRNAGCQQYTHLCGARRLVRQGPRGLNNISVARRPRTPGTPGKSTIHTHLCRAREAPYPGGQEIYTFMWGLGPRTPGTPGGVNNIYTFMWGPGAPCATDPRIKTSM
jgi:hypothetical protein